MEIPKSNENEGIPFRIEIEFERVHYEKYPIDPPIRVFFENE